MVAARPARRSRGSHSVTGCSIGGVAIDDAIVLSDDDLDALVAAYVEAAVLAADAGFEFVDVKHCHGYLLHELLGAVDRAGAYGGSFEHRTAFLRRVVDGIRIRVPHLAIGVRLSAYDVVPYEAGADGVGVPVADADDVACYLFGLEDSHRFLDVCRELGIGLVCITAGSPYYNPHVQRPAFFPPSDGYTPPEDPLVGAARMIAACAELARAHPDARTRRLRVLIPAAVASARCAAHRPHGRCGTGRHRPRHAQLPGAAGRRPGRSSARHVAVVPHVQ